ncbi:hypothetical protein Zmor_012765 [Zophobas morio]|uniref:Uncharacterized protein n=1 Tax=Zophobas morio TaxID=2755281 RepID=A0AA38IGJ1_9CUCU|nr:hypothetical protein Zmor_012765 [Zophobas morio]
MAMPRVLCRVRLLINNDFSVISKYSSVANSVSINKVSTLPPNPVLFGRDRCVIREISPGAPAGQGGGTRLNPLLSTLGAAAPVRRGYVRQIMYLACCIIHEGVFRVARRFGPPRPPSGLAAAKRSIR